MTMSNKQDITNEQLNPADFNKTIPEIAPTPQETDEISSKLASADAIVSAFLEECRADIEKKAKNTEKIAENWRNKEVIGANRRNKEDNGAIRRNLEENANPKEEFGGKCTNTNYANFVNWYFSGEVLRTILRFSLLKNIEIYNHFKISKNKFN